MASNVTPTTGADAMARFNEYLAKMQAAQGVTPGPTVRPRMTAPAPQQGGSMGGGIPMSTSVALGKYIGSQIFGQAAAPAIMANVPAAPVMASALGGAAPATSGLGALSSGSGLATGSTVPASSLATFGAYAGPLAVLATAPIWAPKLGDKLTSLVKGKDNDRRYDVNEVISPLKSGGMTQFQSSIPNWSGRSEDERRNIANKAYELKVLNLIGDPEENMGLMGDARNTNSERLNIGSKLMSFDRKMSRGDEPKWALDRAMSRVPTQEEVLQSPYANGSNNYRQRLADFVGMLSAASPAPGIGASIDPGRIPSVAAGIMAQAPTRSKTSSPGIDKNGKRTKY